MEGHHHPLRLGRPPPHDFDHFLPWACCQLGVDATIIITKSVQSQYQSVSGKDHPKHKMKVKAKTLTESGSEVDEVKSDSMSSTFAGGIGLEFKPVYIETVYDEFMELVQIKFIKNNKIPRPVMKILALMIPYQRNLSSIVINSGLNAEAMHEISKFLPTSRITEMCLDCTLLAEANYHLLLDHEVLKHLSLAKCKINDEIVKTIAVKLAAPCPASKSLSALNLATNRITDLGVKYLAEMLRSNRHLSYLNLSDNMITDDGANKIFDTLVEFALTSKETLDRNNRLMNYLRTKSKLIQKTLKDLMSGDFDKKSAPRRKMGKPTALPTKKKLADKDVSSTVAAKSMPNIESHYFERAEHIAEGIMGPFRDPFGPENTDRKDSIIYCFGNNTLGYLNLAYNNLTYASLKKLCHVLITQSVLGRKPKGLINVRLEGNYLPETCPELRQIDEILKAELSMHKRPSEISRKRALSRSSPRKMV